MGYRFFIARRFLFSRKSHSVINIISIISVFAVMIITAAMIIIMSAINGFEDTVKTLYSNFDPDIKITAVQGKSFLPDSATINSIQKNKGVEKISSTIEEICILKNNDQWIHAKVKGVDANYIKMQNLSDKTEGESILRLDDSSFFVIPGSIIASKLNAWPENGMLPEYLTLYVPLRTKRIKINNDAFNQQNVAVSGVFKISPEIDDQYVFADISMLNNLMQYDGEISAYEIKLKNGFNENDIASEIQNLTGNKFKVQTRYQQKELIYKTNATEKLFVFVILVFVLTLAGFNVIAAVTMLVIDKQKDAETIAILGSDKFSIKRIFMYNGLLINAIGGGLGLILGTIMVLLQFNFHFISLENAIIDYYPVRLFVGDLIKCFVALMFIGMFSSWFPVWLANRKR